MSDSQMNGAESLIKTAVACGIEVCFANPGTTEMPLVIALDSVPGVRAVLGLFEGVCTGAADGYGRMKGKPALTVLHLGPGLGNGVANLHNARRARTPIVNVIGEMATWHREADAPLTSDIVALANSVSGWTRTNGSAEELAKDTADAIAASLARHGQVTTLIVPHDCQLDPAGGFISSAVAPLLPPVNEEAVKRAAVLLGKTQPAALFLGGAALGEAALRSAALIATATGCGLICETFPSRIERGPGLTPIQRLPYFPEQAIELLSQYKGIVLAGACAPVSFFGYPGVPSQLLSPAHAVESLAAPVEDVTSSLEALVEELGAKRVSANQPAIAGTLRPTGQLSLESLAAAIASVQPEDAIIMDEGNTSSAAYFALSRGAPRHSYLTLTGGSIGQGLPCATGAAVACPDRPVIAIQADGAGMYTLQALWTQARESLNVTTVVCANKSYRVLGIELARSGILQPGPQSIGLISLANPVIDWVKLAEGMGVPGVRVDSADVLAHEIERAVAEPGPRLIEVSL